nr:MAG TPA: hypothetical protein [Caudoviricetes sp.]
MSFGILYRHYALVGVALVKVHSCALLHCKGTKIFLNSKYLKNIFTKSP